ncbi:MAG TPA: class I SAM-dependent methyltransferase [Chitinophagaceae bacterium]
MKAKTKEVNERFIWAASVIDVSPADKVLEIGCGAGLLTDVIAQSLSKGKITSVDQSASMIRMAQSRNKEHIKNGKVELVVSAFANTDFPAAAFHKIIAFNVNVFWKNPVRELELIKKILKPKSFLYLFYQSPYETTLEAAMPVIEKLKSNGFEVKDTMLKKLKPTSAYCIVAKPV